jgi:Spy/CpxP family protein refolding chaperone
MKRKIILSTAFVCLGAILYAGQTTDQGNGMIQHRKEMRIRGRRNNPMRITIRTILNDLNLSANQEGRIRNLLSEYRRTMKRERRKIMRSRGSKTAGRKRPAPVSFMTAEKFDKAAFKEAVRAGWSLQDELRMQRRKIYLEHMADTLEKIYGILTSRQRQKLIELSVKR